MGSYINFSIPSLLSVYFHLIRRSHTTVLHFRIQSAITRSTPCRPSGSRGSGCTCNSFLSASPLTSAGEHSPPVSTLRAAALCLSGSVIHFRRQTAARGVGERQLIEADEWGATGMLTGCQAQAIHKVSHIYLCL